MNHPAELTEPYSRKEIIDSLDSVRIESEEYWNTFDSQSFFEPIGEAWSPAENVRHLTKSVRAVTLGLRLPKTVLLLRFGRPKAVSRTYSEVVKVYRAALAAGGKAGKFAPKKREIPEDLAGERTQIMRYHKEAIEAFCDSIGKWSEPILDKRQMPHPLIGKLTVREMLLFSLYHNKHHVENVRGLKGR